MAGVSKIKSCTWAFNESAGIDFSGEEDGESQRYINRKY